MFAGGAVVALLVLSSLGLVAHAANGTNVRPIGDFLDRQVLEAPGFGAGVDWVSADKDGTLEYRARLDFVGVIAKYQDAALEALGLDPLGLDALGTTFDGKVTEQVQKDGRTLVHVELRGKNVFCLVGRIVPQQNPFAPQNRLFGQPAFPPSTVDDLDTVDIHFELKFLTPDAPGSDLPRLRQLLFFPEDGQEVLQTLIVAHGKGRLREAFGVEDGTPGQLSMTMRGIFNASFDPDATDFQRDEWPVGRVDLRAVGK